jgi:tetratricopeptide (TPR) repeat protein
MRISIAFLLSALVVVPPGVIGLSASPAIAAEPAPPPPGDMPPGEGGTGEAAPADLPATGGGEAGAIDVPATDAEPSMDALFADLRDAEDEDAAARAEQRILRRWLESDSDTVDLLMGWALEAIAVEDYPLALDYLNAVVTLAPAFPEGWNKRATVHFLTDDYGKSLSDLRHVLALEPRHFGALSGLGIILRELGRNDQALAAFEAALAVHPYLEEVREAIDDLERVTAGQDI